LQLTVTTDVPPGGIEIGLAVNEQIGFGVETETVALAEAPAPPALAPVTV
jgi:hypothetical protein